MPNCGKLGHIESVCFRKQNSSALSSSSPSNYSFVTTYGNAANKHKHDRLARSCILCEELEDSVSLTEKWDLLLSEYTYNFRIYV